MKLPEVFKDDFQKENQSWTFTDRTAWRHIVDSDRHFMSLVKRKSSYQPKQRSPHNIALINDIVVSDWVLTLDVRSPENTGDHRDCCVFFCYKSPHEFYYVHLGAKPDPNSGQIMVVNNAPRKAITENKNQIAWDDQWHRVKLTRNSSNGEIKLYFDDMKTPIMEASDRLFNSGQIGIGSFDDKNDFDNVQLFGK